MPDSGDGDVGYDANQRALEAGIASGGDPITVGIRLYLAQICIIIGLCQILGITIKRFNQPRVIAEVAGGIILGPTFLGQIPGFTDTIFPTSSITALKMTAVLGLVLFLFIVGLELDPGLLRGSVKRSITISFTGQFCAWMLSLIVSTLMYKHIGGLDAAKGSFTLFIGISMAVTAFPVLSRILTEQRLLSTKVGVATISSAAFDDVIAWCMLALVVAIVSSGTPLDALYVFLLLVAFALFMFFVGRPMLARYLPRLLSGGEVTHSCIFVCLLTAIASGWITEIIGIDAIFGGFIAGLSMPRAYNLPIQVTEKIEEVIATVLLPLYFAVSGLKTDFTALNSGRAWGFVVLVISLSCLGKIVGCGLAARFTGLGKREAMAVGALMNTRGLVEIIILNIGLDAGVINKEVFAIMILMAVFTTFLTSPLTTYIYPAKYHEQAMQLHSGDSSVNAGGAASKALANGESILALPPPAAAASLPPAELLAFAGARLRLLACVPDLKALTSTVKVVRLLSVAGGGGGCGAAANSAGGHGHGHGHGGAGGIHTGSVSISGGQGAGAGIGGHGSDGDGGALSAGPATTIHAVRIVRTSDTYSSDMMNMHAAETLRHDELAGLLQTFGQMNSVLVEPHIAMGTDATHFAQAIVNIAISARRNTVIVPWSPEPRGLIPAIQAGGGSGLVGGNAGGSGSDDDEGGGGGGGGEGGSSGASPGGGEGGSAAAITGEAGLGLVCELLEGAATHGVGNVVVMLDRGLCLGRNRIIVPCLGGPDDDEALMLALALLRLSATELVLLRVRQQPLQSPSLSGTPYASVPESFRRSTGGTLRAGISAAGGSVRMAAGAAAAAAVGSIRKASPTPGSVCGGGGDLEVSEQGPSEGSGDSGDGPPPLHAPTKPSDGAMNATGGGFGLRRGSSQSALNKAAVAAALSSSPLLDAVAKLAQVRVVDVAPPTAAGIDIFPSLCAALTAELKAPDARRQTLVICGHSEGPFSLASANAPAPGGVRARGNTGHVGPGGNGGEGGIGGGGIGGGGLVAALSGLGASGKAGSHLSGGTSGRGALLGGGLGGGHGGAVIAEDDGGLESGGGNGCGEPTEGGVLGGRSWSAVFRSRSRGYSLDAATASTSPVLRQLALGRTGSGLLRALPDVSLLVVHGLTSRNSGATE